MCIGRHVNNRYSCQILMKLEFSRQILENIQVSDLMKIHLVGAELFRAYRQTEIMKLIFGFRKFANPPTRD